MSIDRNRKLIQLNNVQYCISWRSPVSLDVKRCPLSTALIRFCNFMAAHYKCYYCSFHISTVLVLIKLTKNPVRCGCVAVPVNCIFFVISPCFAIFKNVVHSLEPGETPSNSDKYRKLLYNVALRLRCGCVYFFNLLKTSTVPFIPSCRKREVPFQYFILQHLK